MDDLNFLEIISVVSPGTKLREGIQNILEGGLGALIVVKTDNEMHGCVDGGFEINCNYTPEKVFELSKMDGAIILDKEIKKIEFANVHLQPGLNVTTHESGTRHRTSQRIAKQTNNLVIAISERKKVVTIYKGEKKYRLKTISDLTNEASQGISTLERYKQTLNKSLNNLTVLELDDLTTLFEVATVLKNFEKLSRIHMEMKDYLVEMGTEGRFIKLQIDNLIQDTDVEKENFIKDYWNYSNGEYDFEKMNKKLKKLSELELEELDLLLTTLDYKKQYSSLGNSVIPKGYRILSKISKLNKKDVEKIVLNYTNLSNLFDTTTEELLELKDISKIKVKAIEIGLKRLKVTTGL